MSSIFLNKKDTLQNGFKDTCLPGKTSPLNDLRDVPILWRLFFAAALFGFYY
jgi:hypothetical protein